MCGLRIPWRLLLRPGVCHFFSWRHFELRLARLSTDSQAPRNRHAPRGRGAEYVPPRRPLVAVWEIPHSSLKYTTLAALVRYFQKAPRSQISTYQHCSVLLITGCYYNVSAVTERCRPGEKGVASCNSCFCDGKGANSGWVCTLKGCQKPCKYTHMYPFLSAIY